MTRPLFFGYRSSTRNREPRTAILLAGASSLAAYVLLLFWAPFRPLGHNREMIEAAALMQRATAVTRNFCDTAGIEINEIIDPNRTCLVGPELTPLMTTLGHLEAKRTTTDPAMASLMVHLLSEAGVSEGDTIAVGSSASFPALLVATLAAAEAIGVYPVVIISLGASTYGATDTDFNLLDIYELLLNEDVFSTPPAAISLGGAKDVGGEFDEDLKAVLLHQIESSGHRLQFDPKLRTNVAARMSMYGEVAAFVNIGGGYVNLGTSPLALQLQPGLNTEVELPPIDERGVLHEMAANGIPIVHLLFVRGLALRHGIAWDPVPLSEPGEIALHGSRPPDSKMYWMIGVPYLLLVSVLLATRSRLTRDRFRTQSDYQPRIHRTATPRS